LPTPGVLLPYSLERSFGMAGNSNKDINRFFVVGINYRKTDAAVRGQFAINEAQYESIIRKAGAAGISEFFILSTCNRTEIFGLADDPGQLSALLCSETAGSLSLFESLAYIRNGAEAIHHLFRVAAGLDSQILGDYEIVGQLKQAVKFAKKHGFVGTFTERLINQVLSSSKEIKNETALSGGTVSVSFAAVQYIRENVQKIAGKRILLLGTGKIGRNTCKNLVDYLPPTEIVLMNRSFQKAADLAAELNLLSAPIEQLEEETRKADIILVATNAPAPTVHSVHVANSGEKLVIDLSIPNNVAPEIAELPGITLVNVDELSKLKDETLQKREQEVPRALAIIEVHQQEFLQWIKMRQYVPVLVAVKEKLQEIHVDPIFGSGISRHFTCEDAAEEKIQKVINVMAVKMRNQNHRGCQYIEAINEYITPANN